MAVLSDKLQNAWHTWGKGHYSHFRGEETGKLTCFIGRLIHPEGQKNGGVEEGGRERKNLGAEAGFLPKFQPSAFLPAALFSSRK